MHWSSSPENRYPFTLAERDRRWQRLRDEMARQRVDLLVVLPQWSEEDALYVANQFGVVFFPLEGDPSLIIGGEASNLQVSFDSWIRQRLAVRATVCRREPRR